VIIVLPTTTETFSDNETVVISYNNVEFITEEVLYWRWFTNLA